MLITYSLTFSRWLKIIDNLYKFSTSNKGDDGVDIFTATKHDSISKTMTSFCILPANASRTLSISALYFLRNFSPKSVSLKDSRIIFKSLIFSKIYVANESNMKLNFIIKNNIVLAHLCLSFKYKQNITFFLCRF